MVVLIVPAQSQRGVECCISAALALPRLHRPVAAAAASCCRRRTVAAAGQQRDLNTQTIDNLPEDFCDEFVSRCFQEALDQASSSHRQRPSLDALARSPAAATAGPPLLPAGLHQLSVCRGWREGGCQVHPASQRQVGRLSAGQHCGVPGGAEQPRSCATAAFTRDGLHLRLLPLARLALTCAPTASALRTPIMTGPGAPLQRPGRLLSARLHPHLRRVAQHRNPEDADGGQCHCR